jgi:hypothetical protein
MKDFILHILEKKGPRRLVQLIGLVHHEARFIDVREKDIAIAIGELVTAGQLVHSGGMLCLREQLKATAPLRPPKQKPRDPRQRGFLDDE